MSSTTIPTPRESGEHVEHNIVERFDPIDPVPEALDRFDAVASRPIGPDEVPMRTCLVDRGSELEVKACQGRTSSGKRGRWLFRVRQHHQLLEACGYYVLAVYDPKPGHPIREVVIVPAAIVDELLGEWTSIGADRAEVATTKLSWSRVIDPRRVEGDSRR
jgi:hypothetical protein